MPRRARERLLRLDFGEVHPAPPLRRARRSALTAGVALAVVIHLGVLGAVLSWAELTPVREKLIRVILYAQPSENVPALQPPAPVSAALPAPTRAAVRKPAPPALPSEPAPAPAAAPPALAADATSQLAVLAPVPVARQSIAARPRYKRNPEPDYPALARRRRQQGIVLLAVQVDAAGRPEQVEVQVSSGFASLDDAAVAAVKDWEFEPGRLDGQPVASRVEVPIQFQLGPGARSD
jgi:protein TonB